MNLAKNLAGAAVALALIIPPLHAGAASTPSPTPSAATIVSQLTQRMDAVSAYKARIHVALQLHSFPYFATELEGTTSYTRPGHYTVKFDSVPALASAFQNVSGDIGDPEAWNNKYDIAIEPAPPTAEANTVALKLTEKVKGQIDHAIAYVDQTSHTVTRMEWYYASGGRITMDQHFAPIDGVLLVDRQTADFDMPSYKATAQAKFDGYSVQIGMIDHARTPAR